MSLKESAKNVLELLKNCKYSTPTSTVDFFAEHSRSVSLTKVYHPDELSALRHQWTVGKPPLLKDRVQVVAGTTQKVARKMAGSDPLALLNFASARNPGGGFLNGAKAQEEDLCRCSGPYPCLEPCHAYYQSNRQQTSLLYTDHAIFSPEVVFFKEAGQADYLDPPFLASVITCPAPNSGPFLRDTAGDSQDKTSLLESTFLRRWQNVLCIARNQSVERLLLGAWGCGAFGGDPWMAAKTAKLAIQEFGATIQEIVFAIPNKGNQGKRNFEAFENEFKHEYATNIQQ